MSSAPFMHASMMALMMAAMMVPSVAPVLWRHHRALATARVRAAAWWTTVVCLGYAATWTVLGLALVALDAALRGGEMSSMHPSVAPGIAGVIVLWAGALQCSKWKAQQLSRCREMFADGCAAAPRDLAGAWKVGCALGVGCATSCAAPMAILIAVGLMDMRAMFVITAAILAERLAPNGALVAQVTGALALGEGMIICARAIGVA